VNFEPDGGTAANLTKKYRPWRRSSMLTAQQRQEAREAFNLYGYAVLEDVFSEQDLSDLLPALDDLEESGDVDIYHDRDGQIRRMEHFTLKSAPFARINQSVLTLLEDVLGETFVLFKDKYNFKPPGGEGFFAHYDGVFRFVAPDGAVRNGWYEYAPEFVNVLVAVDDFTHENGALEIASAEELDFEELISRTLGDGTPHIRPEHAEGLSFRPITMARGGVAIFRHTCPHRSGLNRTTSPRGSVYWTYCPSRYGDHYEQYFSDKASSKNASKALQGEKFEG